MKRIFIIGNTIGASKAAEWIRQQEQDAEITLISTDGQYPYEADRLIGLVSGEFTQKDIIVQPKDFYSKNKIAVILDKNISKINLKRSRIYTEQKDQWEYDVVIMADLPGKKFPDIKGSNKEGIYNFRSFPQMEAVVKKNLFIETIVVRADSFEGLELAWALRKKDKEVSVIVSEKSFIGRKLSADQQKILIDCCREKGLNIIYGNDLVEILGDSDVKAIRLKSGKVLAAQMIIFEEMREDWRIFSENELQVSDRFDVNESMETSIANVFAFSPIARIQNQVSECNVVTTCQQIKEARAAVIKITGKEILSEELKVDRIIDFDGISLTSSGMLNESQSQQLVAG